MWDTLEIKSQGNSDICLGCAVSSVAEAVVGESCDEFFSFAMGKRASGQSLKRHGLPPKSALLGALEYGVLPKRYSPYSLETHERDFLADWRNWESLQSFAVKPFQSFRKVSDFRSVLPLVVGIYWQGEWDESPYIPFSRDFHKLEPHEVCAVGYDGKYLVLQNSRSNLFGDNGYWYLPENMYHVISHAYEISAKPWRSELDRLIQTYL